MVLGLPKNFAILSGMDGSNKNFARIVRIGLPGPENWKRFTEYNTVEPLLRHTPSGYGLGYAL
jgi:hypothetical protein